MTTPILENWSILFFDEAGNDGPKRAARMGGIVYNHPNIADESPIVTSRLEQFSSATMTAKTKNRKYLLGKPSNTFEYYLSMRNERLSDYDKSI